MHVYMCGHVGSFSILGLGDHTLNENSHVKASVLQNINKINMLSLMGHVM